MLRILADFKKLVWDFEDVQGLDGIVSGFKRFHGIVNKFEEF